MASVIPWLALPILLIPITVSAKIGTVGDTDELRTQMERTRDSAKHLCSQLLQTLQNAEQTPMISRLTKDFGTELKRFEAVSMEIKSRDTKVVEAYSQNTKSGGYFEADLNSDWGAGAVSRHQQQAQQQQQKQMERDVLIPFAVEDMKRRQEEIHVCICLSLPVLIPLLVTLVIIILP